jgi:hydroxylamine reductase (hybrid-cluster protein)
LPPLTVQFNDYQLSDSPKDSYKDRVYTTSVVGFPGLKHIPDGAEGKSKDFREFIAHAKKCPPPVEIETGKSWEVLLIIRFSA